MKFHNISALQKYVAVTGLLTLMLLAQTSLSSSVFAADVPMKSTYERKVSKTTFGQLEDGTAIEAVTLVNMHGVKARIINYGATLQSLTVPDRAQHFSDVVLGYDTLDGYVKTPQYTGGTIGRYANRIAKGQFTIDGHSYQLATNNGPNALHGGIQGFDKRVWKIESFGEKNNTESVTFSYVSPDGEEGYPGTVTTYVTYSLNDNNDLTIQYKATTDQPTVVNLTNHSIFNLSGVPVRHTALDATLQLEADAYLPTDETAIPTGEMTPVKGTPFDFTKPANVDARVRDARDAQILTGLGFDHNYVLRQGQTKKPKLAATLVDQNSGRAMQIFTTEPGIQFYTGNFLNGKIPGKGGQVTRMGDGLALETQHFPNSPNVSTFPTTQINPGDIYTQTTIHHFYVVK